MVHKLMQVSMEKRLKPYDKEYMKMAMLKHEETFKDQVHELHRLYRIQKILMKKIESSGSNGWDQERWKAKNGMISTNQTNRRLHDMQQQKPRKNLDLEQPVEDYIAESDGDGVLEIEDESEIELTLGPTSYNRRKKAEETPLTSDSGPSFSSSSTGSSHIKKTNSGTHQSTDGTREEELSARKWGLVQVPADTNPGFQSGRNNSVDVEEQLRQERLKQPPWLFQVLSLNMT